MIELLEELARVNYSGAPFLVAYGITWLVCGVLWQKIKLNYAAIATLFLLVAVQWAIGIEASLAQFIPTRNVLIMVACIFAFAMVITLTCTFISVTHFLKMQERDLYR